MPDDPRLKSEKDFHNEAFSGDTRKSAKKYYQSANNSKSFYHSLISKGVEGKKILEYGCGPGSAAFDLARKGALVTAIDISEVAINLTQKQAAAEGLTIECFVMDAENLTFKDKEFDIICGSGILHHLDLNASYQELNRTLKPSGRAVFFEPLGHNPIINLYRKITPKMRTDDEHPLLMNDIKLAESYFETVNVSHFNLTSTLSTFLPFLGKPLLSLDSFLFRSFPSLKKQSWIVVLEMSLPKQGRKT
ncbi:MAG: class I SAM-dependent methyltransferase [Balneolales bacterium]